MLKGNFTALRAMERNDLLQLLEWRNLPEFRRYFREYRELNWENQIKWYEERVLNDPQTIMFSLVELSSGILLGAGGLCYVNWVNRNADLSLYIGSESKYIDECFAPDAARVLIDYGFGELGLHRLYAEIYDFDNPKQILFDNLGFVLEGRHRHTCWKEGEWHDSLFYSLLDSDYNKSNDKVETSKIF